jgi:hypothetical protein
MEIRGSNIVLGPGSIARWIARVTDRFVPAACFASAEELRRARLALLLCAVFVSQVPIFASVSFFADGPLAGYSVLAAGALSLLTPNVLRAYSARVGQHYLMTLIFSLLVVVPCVTGGLFAPALWWMSALPVIAMLSSGKRDATLPRCESLRIHRPRERAST